jgi:hypothetical protein
MIEGGWPFVWASYAVALAALLALTAFVVIRLAHWSRRARQIEK